MDTGSLSPAPSTAGSLRVVTYNVRRCLGVDGRYQPERIASVLARTQADVIALQELDANRFRSGGVDQACAIASALRMSYHFHPAIRVAEELYGDAILTHLPMRLVKAAALPGSSRPVWEEPRGALWVEVTCGGAPVQILNTHFGLMPGERAIQAAALLGPDWLGSRQCRGPVILLGDLNARPSSTAYRLLARALDDAQLARGRRPQPTFPGRWPMLRIDHIFLRGGVTVTDIGVMSRGQARVASDHLPLYADLVIPTAAVPPHRSEIATHGPAPARKLEV